ncbi:MAG: JAB domain-containing protein, partial [Pseudomonadota bacterium]
MASSPFRIDLFDPNQPGPSDNAQSPPSYLRDHRKRLRDRFTAGGADAIPDYELLELVLFRAIPRQDVKPLARRLIDTFGSFGAVVSAPIDRLKMVKGVGTAVTTDLKIIAAAAQRTAKTHLADQTVINSWPNLVQYCRTAMAHRDTEQCRVLFLDQKNRLIDDHVLGEGTID